MAPAHCMPDTQGYKHTLRICSVYCSSTATVFARTRLSVTLPVHYLSCLLLTQQNFGIRLLTFWANMLHETSGELKAATCFVKHNALRAHRRT
jgi:hypothetical protein